MSLCFFCPGRLFKDDNALRMHRESKHLYSCNECGKTLKSQQALDQHVRDKHPPFECQYCDRRFSTDEGRLAHEEAIHPPVFECEHCDREFSSDSARQQHEDAKHSFECHYCDDEFYTEEARQEHEDDDHPSTFECEYCNREFSSDSARQQHEDAKHCFECHYCDDEFCTEDARQEHEDAEHPPTFECEYCNREFKSEKARQQHEDAKHSFQCHYCDHEFSWEDARQQHEDSKHAPTFECEYCDREFKSEEARQQHEDAKHSFECRYCDLEFSSEETRQLHEDSKHFECRHCYREFGSEEARKQHEDAKHPEHQSVPRYNCTHCRKDFSIYYLKASHERSCISNPANHGTAFTFGLSSSSQSTSTEVDEKLSLSVSVSTEHRDGGSESPTSPHSTQSTLEEGEMLHSTSAPSSVDANGDRPCASTGSLDPGTDTLVTDGAESVISARGSSKDDSEVTFQCAPCFKIFETKMAFQDHVCAFRTTFFRPQCPMCYTQFDDEPLLQKHLEGLESFSCQLCLTRCCSDEMLQDHLLSHPTCGKCGKSFANNLALCAHVDSDHPVVVCWDCDGIVVENSSLGLHYADSSAHPSCTFCGVGKRNSVDMDEHVRQAHATSVEMAGTDNVNPSTDEDTPLTETQPPRAEEGVTGEVLDSAQVSITLDKGVLPRGPGEEHHGGSVHTESSPSQVLHVDDSTGNLPAGERQYAPPSPEHGSDASRPQLLASKVTCTATNNDIRPPSPVSSVSAASLTDLSTQSPTSLSSNSVVFVSADGIPEYIRENRAILVATSAGSPPSDGTPFLDILNLGMRTREARMSGVNDATATANASRTSSVTHRLHCRICFRNPCEDMTVTICGHLFCKTCITRAVVAKSECPVCKSATLLYCLFKLDLSV